MEKSESIIEITKAIIKVMQAVKGIDKSMTVGSGNNKYKGVSDKDVKLKIGAEMEKVGLAIIPISVKPEIKVDRWEHTDSYGTKMKQSVFTAVTTEYLLTHISGEFIVCAGYGQGIDSQDKGAGKATTYALKYTLLYTFMVATGYIDDSDTTHSDDIDTSQKPNTTKAKERPLLSKGTNKEWMDVVATLEAGGYEDKNHEWHEMKIKDIEIYYRITQTTREQLLKISKNG
jgi:hypothetical protein